MFYHGTTLILPQGFTLIPQEDGYVQQDSSNEIEALFEKARPSHCIPRSQSVFVSGDINLIDSSGGYTDAVYSVMPCDPERSDLAWYTEAQCLLEEGKELEAMACAQNYWIGKVYPNSDHSCTEYRCRNAQVIELVELNVDNELLDMPK